MSSSLAKSRACWYYSPMSIALRLNKFTGDFTILKGRFLLISGPDAIVQSVKVRLLTLLGEWYLNTENGIPYYEGTPRIFSSKTSDNEASWIFRRAILDVKGVERINFFNFSKDVNLPRGFRLEVGLDVEANGTTVEQTLGIV